MKKTIMALVLVAVIALMAVAMVACAKETVYVGEYSYANPWGEGTYGVKANVTVKGDKIVKVELLSDAETGWIRTSTGWDDFQKTEDAYAAYLAGFAGKTVAEINAITVDKADTGIPSAVSGLPLAGATQSAGRIILAVQNALSKIGK
jgi:major membrane immunogen (membrane-anchored lipoprotein)